MILSSIVKNGLNCVIHLLIENKKDKIKSIRRAPWMSKHFVRYTVLMMKKSLGRTRHMVWKAFVLPRTLMWAPRLLCENVQGRSFGWRWSAVHLTHGHDGSKKFHRMGVKKTWKGEGRRIKKRKKRQKRIKSIIIRHSHHSGLKNHLNPKYQELKPVMILNYKSIF